MFMNKNHYCGLILVFGIFLSILICGGVSAVQVNNTTHTIINDSKTVHNNSIIIKKLGVTGNSNKTNNSAVNKSVTLPTSVLPSYYDLLEY